MSNDLVIACEPLATLLDDGLEALVRAEYDEVSVKHPDMPLALDWEQYFSLDHLGILRVLGARRDDALIGYSAFMVMPHLHYAQTVHALNDAIYVTPSERGVVGLRLILEAERQFPRPIRIVYYSKDGVQFGRVSTTDGMDSLDLAHESLELMEEYGVELPQEPLPERGTLGDLLAFLGYARFETAFGKFMRVP